MFAWRSWRPATATQQLLVAAATSSASCSYCFGAGTRHQCWASGYIADGVDDVDGAVGCSCACCGTFGVGEQAS